MPMQRVLITGSPGCGKSTLCRALSAMGVEAHDIEAMPGMFRMLRRSNGEPFDDIDNGKPEMIADCCWKCEIKALRKLMESQAGELAFFCGAASNIEELIPLFDRFILLHVSRRTLRSRLMNREGGDRFLMGCTEESRQLVLSRRGSRNRRMFKLGASAVSGEGAPDVVAQRVLRACAAPPTILSRMRLCWR